MIAPQQKIAEPQSMIKNKWGDNMKEYIWDGPDDGDLEIE